jgi:hypothetical protein
MAAWGKMQLHRNINPQMTAGAGKCEKPILSSEHQYVTLDAIY